MDSLWMILCLHQEGQVMQKKVGIEKFEDDYEILST